MIHFPDCMNQLLDLSSQHINLLRRSKTSLHEVWTKDTGDFENEQMFVTRVIDSLASAPLKNAKTAIIVPNRWILFKIVRSPTTETTNIREKLKFEVENAFPYGSTDLEWCYVPITRNDFEESYLVGGVKGSLLETLRRSLIEKGIKKVHFYSNANLCFRDFLKLPIKPKNSTIFCFWESNSGVILSANHKWIASRTVRSSQHASLGISNLKAELQRFTSLSSRKADFTWNGVTIYGHNVANRSKLKGAFADTNLLNFEDRRESFPSFEILALLDEDDEGLGFQGVFEKRDMPTSINLTKVVAFFLLGLIPYPFVYGLLEVNRDYQSQIKKSRRLVAANDIQRADFLNLKKELELKIDRLGVLRRNQAIRIGWGNLLNDLQLALFASGDSWIDQLDLDLDDGAFLNFEGRFLVRELNLDESVRLEVVEATEARLKKLRELLLDSTYIDSFSEFRVNYSGIEKGINVVAFHAQVELGTPFQERRLNVE